MVLADLLNHYDFGLELLTGADERERPVEGAHAIELPDPGRWIDPGWIVLSTGIALRGGEDEQVAIVRSLCDAGAAALGFGVGIRFRRVPEALLQEARRIGFPVFSVPLEVPFNTLVRFVMEGVIGQPWPQVSHLLALQERLLEALSSPDPEQTVVEELERQLGGRAALIAHTALHPDEEPELGWTAAARADTGSSGGYRVSERELAMSLPVHVDDAAAWFLTIVVPRTARTQAYLRPVARFAATVLQMAGITRRAEQALQLASRSALLEDLLAGSAPTTDLLERLRAFGFDRAQPVRCAVLLDVAEEAGGDEQRVLKAADRFFADRRIARLMRQDGATMTMLWQGSFTGAGLSDVLAAAGAGQPAIGIGPAVELEDSLVRSASGARAAALEARSRAESGGPVAFEELDYSDVVLACVDPRHLLTAPTPLDALRRQRGDMLGTLIAYIEHDMDAIACANALHLHPNSLRYRLSRIEQHLGRSLRSPATIADVYLALRAERVYGQPPPRGIPAAERRAARSGARLN
jgi:purine catabolism regulator